MSSTARGTVTDVDDGTNTNRVTERANGSNTVVVWNDATGKTVGGYTGSASNVSVAGEHVTIGKNGAQTVTTIDNGTSTATVKQNGASASVSVGQDRRPVAANPWVALLLGLGKPNTAAPTAASAPVPVTTAPGSAPAASSGTTAATPATGTTASSASGSSTGAASAGSTSAAPTDLASLMALSPDQFMQAVTSGKIPPDVANDQSAMMQVQARMNQITQMNQLVTSMMAAAHQMQMSIIQNIRC